MKFNHTVATYGDISSIDKLMSISIKGLLKPLLDKNELEASYESMGLDKQLIDDGTYFLIFEEDNLVRWGGWSYRKTLFGSNNTPDRDGSFLNPKKDAARIRAMYTHPSWARKGIGSLVMKLAEKNAKNAGFLKCELMATLSGLPLYKEHGYSELEDVIYKSALGNRVRMIRMEKKLL